MTPLLGLTTMVLTAADVDAASDWYSEVLEVDPYFRQPPDGPAAYVEFRTGPDHDELGIMSRAFLSHGSDGPGTSITYWHVENIQRTRDMFLAAGAQPADDVVDRGEGFATCSVIDPFGNVLGFMHSPHWAGQHEGPATA